MFKKNERLSRPEFTNYFNKGSKHHFTHFTIITSPHSVRKVAVVVGKKVAKLAVRRNALKRRIYAQLKECVVRQEYTGVLIVIVKPGYNSLSRTTSVEVLMQAISEVFKKVST